MTGTAAVTVPRCHPPFSTFGRTGDTFVPCHTLPLSVPSRQATSPWPLTVSPRTLLFLVTWPFVTQWLLRRWQGKKR